MGADDQTQDLKYVGKLYSITQLLSDPHWGLLKPQLKILKDGSPE